MPVNARVLIVEDDYATQQALSALLKQLGHTPVAADTAADALRILDSNAALDVIVTDVVMPKMNGIEFAARVRSSRPSLPVVLVTGDSDVVDDVLASGAVALLKPYSPDTLRRVLKEALDNRRA
jgi:CheY-like chemotaxis protein